MTEKFTLEVYQGQPSLKGNGFDGLFIGSQLDREWAEKFIAWINERLEADRPTDEAATGQPGLDCTKSRETVNHE